MNRKEVCALIREYELGEEVKQRFGDNYTRIPTKKLEQVLWDYDCTLVDSDPYADDNGKIPLKDSSCNNDRQLERESMEQEEQAEVGVGEEQEEETNPETLEVDSPYEAACIIFVSILKASGKLDEILAKL